MDTRKYFDMFLGIKLCVIFEDEMCEILFNMKEGETETKETFRR